MSFLPPTVSDREVPPSGSADATIAIIGEAPGVEEVRNMKPFTGPAGSVLESCMHAAAIARGDCYITNVVRVRPPNNDISPYFNPRTGSFTSAGDEWVNRLYDELNSVRANVLVPLGAVSLAAITGRRKILKYRGYVMESISSLGKRKVIPTIHPSAALRGNYIYRYYITGDLRKAKIESAFPEIKRPERRLVIPETLAEVREWIDYLKGCERLSCDIEVVNFEVSCIGFSPTSDLAVTIPLYHVKWSLEDEATIWKLLAELLEHPPIIWIFQNGIFDIQFLATQCGIKVANWDMTHKVEDTMIAHHIMYPEMLKGLEFLVSCYCGAQEYYKDMVKWNNIKEDS